MENKPKNYELIYWQTKYICSIKDNIYNVNNVFKNNLQTSKHYIQLKRETLSKIRNIIEGISDLYILAYDNDFFKEQSGKINTKLINERKFKAKKNNKILEEMYEIFKEKGKWGHAEGKNFENLHINDLNEVNIKINNFIVICDKQLENVSLEFRIGMKIIDLLRQNSFMKALNENNFFNVLKNKDDYKKEFPKNEWEELFSTRDYKELILNISEYILKQENVNYYENESLLKDISLDRYKIRSFIDEGEQIKLIYIKEEELEKKLFIISRKD